MWFFFFLLFLVLGLVLGLGLGVCVGLWGGVGFGGWVWGWGWGGVFLDVVGTAAQRHLDDDPGASLAAHDEPANSSRKWRSWDGCSRGNCSVFCDAVHSAGPGS